MAIHFSELQALNVKLLLEVNPGGRGTLDGYYTNEMRFY